MSRPSRHFKFQQFAHKAARAAEDERHGSHHKQREGSDLEIVPIESSIDEISPNENESSWEGSEAETSRDRKNGLVYQKTENIFTRIRDMIGQSDVFTTRSESPPFIACFKVSVWMIPVLLMFLIWDTMSATILQIPHHSFVNHPGFLLIPHLLMVMFAMYGFMLAYLSTGISRITKQAGLSLIINFVMTLFRLFMEVFFDGYRGQRKLYLEKTLKVW